MSAIIKNCKPQTPKWQNLWVAKWPIRVSRHVYSFDTVYPYGIMLGHEKEKIPKQIWKIVETIPYRSYSMFRHEMIWRFQYFPIGVLLLSAIMTWRIADYRENTYFRYNNLSWPRLMTP